jgi:hypothetical protein
MQHMGKPGDHPEGLSPATPGEGAPLLGADDSQQAGPGGDRPCLCDPELLKAMRAEQLVLARADLVGAMDPMRVKASEISYLNSTFHFVLDRSAQ